MKRRSALLLLLALALPLSCAPAGDDATIPGWRRAGSTPDAYLMTLDRASPHSGTASAHLRSITPSPTGFGTLMQTIDAAPYRGKRVRLTAHVRSSDVKGWAGLWMRVDGSKSGQILAFDNMQSRSIHGSSPWTPHSVVLDVSPEASQIAFGLLLSGCGEIWFDDVSIEVVGSEVAITASTTRDWIPAGSDPGDYDMGIDPEAQGPQGQRGLSYLRSKGPTAQGFGTWMKTIDAAPYRGKRVRISAQVEATHIENWAGLWMRVDGPQPGRYLAFDNMLSRPIRGSSPWTPHSVVLDVPHDATKIAFGTLLHGAGALRIDGPRLDEVGPDVPTTAPTRSSADEAPQPTAAPAPPPDGQWGLVGSAPADYRLEGDPSKPRGSGARLRSSAAEPAGFGATARTVDAAPYRGKRVRLSAQAQATDVQGWAGLWMRVDGPEPGKSLAFDNMQSRPIRGTSPWTPHSVVLDIPPEATRITFGALLSGAGTLDLADLSLSVAESTEPSTDLRTPRKPNASPMNLRFEQLAGPGESSGESRNGLRDLASKRPWRGPVKCGAGLRPDLLRRSKALPGCDDGPCRCVPPRSGNQPGGLSAAQQPGRRPAPHFSGVPWSHLRGDFPLQRGALLLHARRCRSPCLG